MQRRHYLFIPFLSLLFLIAACEQTGDTSPNEPSIVNFTSSSGSNAVAPNTEVTLSWDVNNATSLSIDNGVGTVTGTSTVVTPTQTTTYTLTASNGSRTDSEKTTVTVTGEPPAPGSPVINSFTATPPTIEAGETSVLSWSVTDAATITIDNGIGNVTSDDDNSVEVLPTATTTYEITATNDVGSVTSTATVTVGGSGGDTADPTGTFGVSLNAAGPFQSDDPFIDDADDNRIIDVEQGGTFYAQVDYTDPSGITAIELRLVNSSPDGIDGPLNPSQEGFEIVSGPTGANCDLSNSPIDVTCVYEISVGNDVQPITERTDQEFAYIFRARVTDGAGNQSDDTGPGSRGYVNVEADGNGGGDTTTTPVIDNFAAASTTITEGESTTLSWSLSGDAATSVTIDNGVGDVTDDDDNTVSVSPTETTTYTLTATNAAGNNTSSATITVNPASSPEVVVDITPDNPTIAVNTTEQFTANVTGSQNTDVTWSLDANSGTLNDNSANPVTYTAPDSDGTYTLTATSVADSSKSDSVTITVQASGAVIIDEPVVEAINDNMSGEGSLIELDILAEDVFPMDGYSYPEITITRQPDEGEVALEDGVQYFPEEGFVGTTTFEYAFSITDQGTGETFTSNSATVTVNVTD